MKTLKNNQLIRNSGRNSGIRTLKRQAGVTLIEAMISLALSLIVTSAMVVLMANSMGTSTRIIQMSQLTDELRNAMSMMTRDVRRANYSANAIFCYGNSNCGFPGGAAEQEVDAGDQGDITIETVGANTCLTFRLDRNFDGDSTDNVDVDDNDGPAGFRRVISGGVGVIEMWTGVASPNCSDAPRATGWVELTDPNTVNITQFVLDDTGSIVNEFNESKTKTFNSRQRQLDITIQGQLVLEEDMGNVVVLREIKDIIYVRNDFIPDPAI